jgi:hypothetical protein
VAEASALGPQSLLPLEEDWVTGLGLRAIQSLWAAAAAD